MLDFLYRLFDTSDFPARWKCGHWTPGHGWLHILSDLGVWSAYLAIPIVLGFFLQRRKDLPFRRIFLLFGAFIFACGTTHLMEAIIFWWPAYRLAGVIKLITAIISWTTVFALVPIVPRVLAMRSPESLEREIAARKQAEESLHQANLVLEQRVQERTTELTQADRHKDEFLATLAHELRNPLAPIKNSLEILRRANGQAEIIEQARSTMERQMGQMVRLVDDLLDISRISRNKIELRKQQIELASIIRQAVETCQPLLQSGGHEVALNLPAEPIHLIADPVRLTQVFSNLLNNACKFTNQNGRIELTAVREGQSVLVSVKDNGIGIAPEMLSKVFEMFAQVGHSLEREHGGLGIGLAIVQRLVQMHGGTVVAHSEGRDQGCEFVVRLPILQSPVQEPPVTIPSDPVPAQPRRILVVDDNLDSARSLIMLLELTEFEAVAAHDGVEAVEKAEAYKPDVIVMDLGLPKRNGYDACRLIRQENWGREACIIAMTGWGQEEDRRKSKEAGFDGHLVKPVSFTALMALVEESSRDKASRSQPQPTSDA